MKPNRCRLSADPLVELRLDGGSIIIMVMRAPCWRSEQLAGSSTVFDCRERSTGARPSIPRYSSDQCQPIDKPRCTGEATPTSALLRHAASVSFVLDRDIFSCHVTYSHVRYDLMHVMILSTRKAKHHDCDFKLLIYLQGLTTVTYLRGGGGGATPPPGLTVNFLANFALFCRLHYA